LQECVMAAGECNQIVGFFQGPGEWLFHQRGNAALQKFASDGVMIRGWNRDDNRLGQLQEWAVVDKGTAAKLLGDALGLARIEVGDTDQFHPFHGGKYARVLLAEVAYSDNGEWQPDFHSLALILFPETGRDETLRLRSGLVSLAPLTSDF
jgi:hypothetical protein